MINRVFAGRYQVTEKIGTGGMAEVYKATDKLFGRTVALKTMLPQYAADPTFAARFRQEAQAAANLSNPYIVNIYDWGKDEDTYFIVMEYIRGIDLKSAIRQRGAINERKAAEIGTQICSALSAAHAYDIIHRDIKPQNIMIQPDGNVKVMDFGIAKAGNSSLTTTDSVLGTAHYVSPEQAQGKHLGPQSDLYSLGIVLYECVTGHLPFDGPDAVSVAMKQVTEEPLPPSNINADLDPTLEAIIMHALEKDPANRFANASDMKDALANWLTGRPVMLTSSNPDMAATEVINPATAAAATSVMPNRTVSTPQDSTSVIDTPYQPYNQGTQQAYRSHEVQPIPQKKSKGPIIAGIVALVAVIAIIAVVLAMRGGGTTSGTTIPDVTGMTKSKATSTITSSGFTLGDVSESSSETVAAGYVISQSPEGGTSATAGAKISLVISTGPATKTVSVPDLSGMSETEAQQALNSANLKFVSGTAEYSDTVAEGKVIKQSPAAGTTVDEGTSVTYVLSKGAEASSVPDVTGMTKSDAVTTLNNAGFEASSSTDYSDTVSEGLVISYSPTSAKKGDTVNIVISKGPESKEVSVPNVVGMSESSATSTLQNAGFAVNSTSQSSDVYASGYVISYSPDSAVAGATVTIVVSTGPEPSPTPTPTTGGGSDA